MFEKSYNSLELIDIKSYSGIEDITFYDNSKEFHSEKEFPEDDFYIILQEKELFAPLKVVNKNDRFGVAFINLFST